MIAVRASNVTRKATSFLVEAAVVLLLVFLAWWAIMIWQDNERTLVTTPFPGALDSGPGVIPNNANGYLDVTAAALNRSQPGESWLGYTVHYVDADQVSTGPRSVSVHPISPGIWADVALGSNRRCYAELDWSSRNGQSGWEYKSKFPRGTACKGAFATWKTVREYRPGHQWR
jgi:hypothetical protein